MKTTSAVIRNAQAVTPQGVITHASIVIEKGRIAAITTQRVDAPATSVQIDAQGSAAKYGAARIVWHTFQTCRMASSYGR